MRCANAAYEVSILAMVPLISHPIPDIPSAEQSCVDGIAQISPDI